MLISQNISKNILLLNSYNQGFSWTDRLTNSITENLGKGKFKVNVFIEYLDTKRIQPDSAYYAVQKELFEKKYSKNKFNVIISTDDDAFFFLLKYRDILFPKVPVIACGLGGKNEKLVDRTPLFFGVYDDIEEKESFYKSLNIFPQKKNIVFISDQTTTGKSSVESIKIIIAGLKDINPVFLVDNSAEEIMQKLNKMPDNTIVYPLLFNYDKSGKLYSHAEFVSLLAKSINLPIIASAEEQMGNGALGGFVHSGQRHGKIAAEMALKVLDGEDIKMISYSKDSLVIPIFDYKYLERFSVSESTLPAGSLILNKPVSFYQIHKTLILVISSIIIALITIIIVISINIIKRKQAEVKLRKLSYAVEQSPVSIVITDTEGVIDYVNPKYSEVTGYSYDESVGHNISMLKGEETPHDVYKRLWETITSGKEWKGEICNTKKNGELFWESIAISPLLDLAGNITHYVEVKEDTTERKRNEQVLRDSKERLETTLKELKLTQNQVLQQERLRSIGQMASGIAHDINNSLMPILGYSDLLLFKKNLDPSLEKKINAIKTASLDIKRTIERMKELYKPKIDYLEFSGINLNDIIRSAIEFTKHRWKDMAESYGTVIVVKTDLGNDLPLIKGNESELRETLINLILNSCDAMPRGGELTFNSRSVDSRVIIELSDTGIGMNEETVKHCFDPFYTTKGERGTGLGLSMVYGIIQRHNAQIEVTSSPGIGTKIKLIFINDVSGFMNKKETSVSLINPLKILCIDDNEEARELLQNILQNDRHNIVLSESGREGIKEFFDSLSGNCPFDVVITDLGMPYMDGKSVSEAIKSKSPATPIILMTGWGAFIEPESIKSVDYILKKPITVNELNIALNTVMKKE
jgi:PAS domain S-box-containing protein